MSSPFNWPPKPSPRDGPHGGAPGAQPHAPDSLPPQTVVGSSCTPLSKKGATTKATEVIEQPPKPIYLYIWWELASPPDIAACSVGRSCGTCLCVWAGGLTCDRRRGRSRLSFGWDRGGATPLPQGSDAALPCRPGRSWPARRPGRGLGEGEDSAAVARPVIGTSHRT